MDISPEQVRWIFIGLFVLLVSIALHEFGHAMHNILTQARYAQFAGANVARDFVELPSQFYEHWALEPAVLARYVARKGSITVDGVSLTVNRVEADVFEANLIPHTLAVTTLARLAAGAKVNLEVDLIARYVERMVGGD